MPPFGGSYYVSCMGAFWHHEGNQGWSLCFSCWYACLLTSWIVAGWLIARRLESSCGMNWSWNVYSCWKEIRICCYPCILPCYACVFDVSTESLVGIRALFVGMRAYWRHERALFMTSVLPLRTMKTKHWRRKAEWGSDVPCTQTGTSTVLCICLLLPRRGVLCSCASAQLQPCFVGAGGIGGKRRLRGGSGDGRSVREERWETWSWLHRWPLWAWVPLMSSINKSWFL